MNAKGLLFNPIDLIAGVVIILAGISTMLGMVNLGVVLAGIGLLIEGLKIILQQGFYTSGTKYSYNKQCRCIYKGTNYLYD